MAGFDNETVYFNNIDPRGVVPVAPQMVLDGQLLIGVTGGNPTVNTLTAGANISIINTPGNIKISASGGGGGGGGTTSLAVDTSSGSGTNPVAPDGGNIIHVTGAQISSGSTANVIRTDSTSANQMTIEIQRSTTTGAADSTKNGVSHFNSAQFSVDSNGFVSQAPSVPLSFPTDTGTATPSSNMVNVVSLANDGIATTGVGNTITITSADDLAAVEALSGTGYATRTGANTWANRTFQQGTGITISNPAGIAGDSTIAVNVSGIPSIATTYQSSSGNATPALNILKLIGSGGIDTSASGNTVTFNLNLTEQPTIATSYVTDSGTAIPALNILDVVSLANDGISVTGASNTITVTSANDLAALEALSGTGFAARTGVETWALRSLVQGTGISITNPAGIAGDPTIAVSANVPSTFQADIGTATPASNNIKIFGGTGISTTASGDTVTVTGKDATSLQKGIAVFPSTDFTVSSGSVALADSVVKSVGSGSGTATPTSHNFNILGTGGITTSGSGANITIDGSGVTRFTWIEVTGTSATYLANQGIFANNASLVTLTLPASAAIGDSFAAYQEGAGKVRIAQNNGQQIRFGNQLSTSGVGGYIQSLNQGDCVTIVAVDTNRFRVINSEGSWTVA